MMTNPISNTMKWSTMRSIESVGDRTNTLIVTMGYLSLPPIYMDSVDYFIFFRETNIRDLTQQYNIIFKSCTNILKYKDIHDKLDKYGYILYDRKNNNITVF